jgi:hypothetical protein
MSNLENLFVIELIFVKESGNSIKYGFTTAEQVIGFLQGEIAAQQPLAVDVANAFCKCVDPHFDIVESCSVCGKPPRH